jgi:deoxyribodipyrimidine photolyase
LAVIYCFESQQYSKQDYQWIVQALKELEKTLNKLSIPLIVLIGEPKARMKGCINHLMPASIYFDIASSGNSNELPQYVAEHASCSVYAVEADLLKDHKITCHPHTWSGPVIPISQLEERIHEELTSFNNF